MNLNTNCMFRAAPCARTGLLVVSGVRLIVPKLFENLALVAGSPKFARFRTLKTSQRNWNFVRSVSRVSLKRLMSHCAKRSEEHTSELQSRGHLVCRLLLEKK